MRRNREWIAALGVAALVAFAFQGTRPLWEPDEGRYTNVAHQMLDSGDWIVPRLDPQHEHLSKPPVTYWAIAASLRVLDHGQWAARLPNALAFVATAMLLFLVARRFAPDRALIAACCWATMLGPMAAANIISSDTLLAAFETLAVYFFVSSGLFATEPRVSDRRILLMWVSFALAFMVKGPPALLPSLAIAAWTVKWHGWAALARVCSPPGVLAFTVIGLSWFILLALREPGSLPYFLGTEVVQRVVSPEFHRNAGTLGVFRAYGPIIVFGTLPWLLILAFVRGARVDPSPADRQARSFLWMWLLLPLIVLLFVQSRLPLYILPLFVPLAILVGWRLPVGFVRSRAMVACVAGALVAMIAIKGIGAHLDSPRDASKLARELQEFAAPGTYDDIVFVDTRPIYGLRHYLGKVIERAETQRDPAVVRPFRESGSLCEELRAQERSLYVVKRDHLASTTQYSSRCGYRIHEVGRLRDYVVTRSAVVVAAGQAPANGQATTPTSAQR